jgi:hypothetical protein
MRVSCIIPPLLHPHVFGWLLCGIYCLAATLGHDVFVSFVNFCQSIQQPNDGTASAPHIPPRLCTLSNILPAANTNFWLVDVLSNQTAAT